MKLVRRSALGIGAVSGLAMISKLSAAEPKGSNSPQSEPQDAWLEEGGRRHRIVFDTTSAPGLGLGMNFAKNFFVANHEAYGIEANELSVVVILRHSSTPLAFSDVIWDKYGDFLVDRIKLFDPRTKAPPRVNLFDLDLKEAGLPNGTVTLMELAKLGTRFAVCAMAVKNLAKLIGGNTHGDVETINDELEANLIPNAIKVSAGIIVVNRAQEHGYTFSYCG
jgi:hypothetical protein